MALAATRELTLVDMTVEAQYTTLKSVQACVSLCKLVQACAKRRSGCGEVRDDNGCDLRQLLGLAMALATTRELDFGRYGHGGSMRLSRVRASLCEPVQACASLCEASIRVW